jgi:hypothetical protein
MPDILECNKIQTMIETFLANTTNINQTQEQIPEYVNDELIQRIDDVHITQHDEN